jgi:transcriptional repressor NrdR
MKCPYCSSTSSKVVDKRDKNDEGVTRRRRECLECSKRYTTYERVENIDLSVRKKDGSLQQYDRNKLVKGVRKAVNMDRVGEEGLRNIVDQIEMKLLNMDSTEVDSRGIGKLVLDSLRELDHVAYMRFASVYNDFDSLDQFRKEIDELEK